MISIIIPVKNEQDNVVPLYNQLVGVLTTIEQDYEIVFVDDGSTDNTVENLVQLLKQDENSILTLIELRHNFQKSAAMTAGFNHAKGDIIITMDGDLQDDPHDIPKMLEALKPKIDVVCGWRKVRRDPFFIKRVPSLIYNLLNRLLNGVKIHDNDCNFRAYRRDAVEDLILLKGDHRFVPAILANRGFKITEVKVNHRERQSGKTKYGFTRLFKGLIDLFSFRILFTHGERPLRLFFCFGMVCILSSLGFGIYLLIEKFYYYRPIGHRPLVTLTALLMISGFQFFFTGMLGELIVRHNIKTEKLYTIKKVYKKESINK